MVKIGINLLQHRLQLRITKRRGSSRQKTAVLPSYKEIRNIRSGNKLSRIFRHVFEHNNIKKLLGTNLAILALAAAFVPATPTQAGSAKEETFVITQDRINLITQKGVQYPVSPIKITQGYKFFHPGFDLDGNTGDAIKPIMAGEVESTGWSSLGYGNEIVIDHGNQITSLYAHLSKILVKVGQQVDKNTVIGLMGSTGRSTGSHLHLEIRDHNISINPGTVLPK